MISIRPLTTAEIEDANRESRAAYWSFPIAFSVATVAVAAVLHWLFGAPWVVAWWCIGGVFVIFGSVRVVVGNRNKLPPEAVVAERQGRVVQAVKKGNRPLSKVNVGQYVEITLEPDTIADPYPQRDTFVVWQTVGMPYYRQDDVLRDSYADLVGKAVRLTYLPDSGKVVAFEVIAHGNPLLAGERVSLAAGTVAVTRSNGHNEQMALADVDYVSVYSHRADDPNNPFYVNFRSNSVAGVSVSSLAWGFRRLEEALPKQLDGFDTERYDRVKSNVGSDPTVVWKRPLKVDARIVHPIAPEDLQDIERGIYLEDRQQLLPWGTFAELLTTDGVETRGMTYPNPNFNGYAFAIERPTIFGLEIRELTTETPSWPEGQQLHPRWPVTMYRADIALGDGGRAGFEALTAHFRAALGAPDSLSDGKDDSVNGLRARWERDSITLEIGVWIPYQSDDYRPACSLSLTRKPDLTEFYVSTYTESLELHDQLHYTVLPGKLEIPLHYINHPTAKYLPAALKPLVQADSEYIVWRDESEGVIGVGTHAYAHMLSMEQVDRLKFVGDYWRDAAQSLSLYCSHYLGAFHADESEWSAIQEAMAQGLGLPHSYAENRQYY